LGAFEVHIDDVMQNYTSMKNLKNGRTAFWQEETGTVVITDPSRADFGTAFQPDDGVSYFNKLQ